MRKLYPYCRFIFPCSSLSSLTCNYLKHSLVNSRRNSSHSENEAVLRKRHIDKAMSRNRERKAIGFSRETPEPVDHLMDVLQMKYPSKSRTHIFDFQILNGVLSEHLIRRKWPKITALESCHMGNLYSVLDSHVPPFIDYQFAVDNMFAFTPENSAVVRSVMKGFSRDGVLPQGFASAMSNESLSYSHLTSYDENSKNLSYVAVGCFSPTNLTWRKLIRYGYMLLYNTQCKTLNALDILAYFPDDSAQIILSETLTKSRAKFFLDLFCDIEHIGSYPTECFEGFFKTNYTAPKNLNLIHIRPRPIEDTLSYFGLTPEDFIKLYTFFSQCSYTPVRKFHHCLKQLTLDHFISLLSDEQLNMCVKDSTLKEFVDIYHTLNQDSAFEIVLNSWWRQNHGDYERMAIRKPRKRIQHEKPPEEDAPVQDNKSWEPCVRTQNLATTATCFAI